MASKKKVSSFSLSRNLAISREGIVSYFLCISFVSGLESRGLSKLFIVNTKGLLKLILHFLNVLIVSANFEFFIGRLITDIFVHSTIPLFFLPLSRNQ